MRRPMEGSRAVAEVIARCRPQVVPAYPITPQTHIVEALGAMVKGGSLAPCEFLTVESEFGAMSVAIGASAAGSRAYTATASQGLLYMTEALFNAAGLGLPVVMTVANRAIGAPINIWNDQSDSLSQRDCGWIQLYAADIQSAVDLHPLAFRLAEEVSVPVMVCMDGFVLTHAVEPVDVPPAEQVDAFLPPFRPRQRLDVDDPVAIGALVGPEAFTEVRYLSYRSVARALDAFGPLAADYARLTGREPTLVERYGPEDAATVFVCLGSAAGAARDVVDARPGVAAVTLTAFRPFPAEQLRAALAGARDVLVLERSLPPGSGGVVSADVRTATDAAVHAVVTGLGGRPVTARSLGTAVDDAEAGRLPGLHVLDLGAEALR